MLLALSLAVVINFVEVVKAGNTVLDLFLELVSKELNHLAAILHVYARGLIFIVKKILLFRKKREILLHF